MHALARLAGARWLWPSLLLAWVGVMQVVQPTWLRRLDDGYMDWFLRARASGAPEDRVVVVDIGEPSIQTVGPWPWPRGRLADLIEAVLAQGAAGVAVDVVFPEPGDAAGDARLAALAQHAPVALAQILDATPRAEALRVGELAGGMDGVNPLASVAGGYLANHAGLAGARCVGNIGFTPDGDGVLRRLPLWMNHAGRAYPSLELALLRCARESAPALDGAPWAGAPRLLSAWRVPFHRSAEAFVAIEAADVLRGAALPPLAGKLVLVGSTALGLGDRVNTPLGPHQSGLLVHAQALSVLLHADDFKPPPWLPWVWVVFWLLGAFWMLGWVGRGRSGASLAWLTGLSLCGAGLYGLDPTAQALWGSLFGWILGCVGVWVGATLVQWRLSQTRVSGLMNTLLRYVAKPVVHAILKQDLRPSLAPRMRTVTVLVADLQDYTALTARLPLDEAGHLTADLLELLTQAVLAFGGTIDKFTGDGLVAFWGAPEDCADQADRAADAALTVSRRMQAWNARRDAAGLPLLRVRMGIESGPALVGDFGNAQRSTYTAVGDCINHASRLEAAAKNLPVDVLLGPHAAGRLQQHQAVWVAQLTLRGAEDAISVFTVAEQTAH